MTAEADEGEVRPRGRWRRMRRRSRATIVLLFVLALTAVGAWTQRKPIARNFVDQQLSKRGVPARYEITDLGFGRQRLRNVVIGDPKDPDLVADWVELGTAVGLGGVSVDAISAGQVRVRARLIDGRMSFGAIDRLMPPSSGKPFALPEILADVTDLRLRVETKYGVVGAKVRGRGRLNDGFAGRLALVADTLNIDGCRLTAPRAALALRISGERPSIDGPVRLAEASCGSARLAGLASDIAVTLEAALDRWTGRARFAAGRAEAQGVRATQLLGNIGFQGTAAATGGDVMLKSSTLALASGNVSALAVTGRYRVGTAGGQFAGEAAADRARLDPAALRALRSFAAGATATPVGPLAQRLAQAATAFTGDFAFRSSIEAVMQSDARAVRIARAQATSASGGRITVDGAPLRFGALEVGGRIAMTGGGLPQALVSLHRIGNGGLAGRATIAPYAVGNARLVLTPVDFVARDGGITEVRTTMTLTGPLGSGRVEDLSLPIDARLTRGQLRLNQQCAPLAWRSVRVSGLALDPARLTLCPLGEALATIGGGVAGGARIAAPRLTGRLGSSPLAIAAADATVLLGQNGFALSNVKAGLGAPGRATLIDATQLTGRIVGGSVAGNFEGAGGRVGNVPLLLSKASGRWTLDGGQLGLEGALTVSDAAAEARFHPLVSDDVTFRLANDQIIASGTLHPPGGEARVANVEIQHRLSSGAGTARFSVPGLVFESNGLQPEKLTPITYGVIADVQGKVSGEGQIEWNGAGVTSVGTFRTQGLNLAAAFGPVSGIKGEVSFSDLLDLKTAPGQVATVASINPGIAVENGTIHYQLVGDQRVQVEGGRWPFAGGELTLEPTLLDFGKSVERRMTFRVSAVDAGAFLQQFDFDNLNATGTFDGVLPMVFDESGGRIEDGRLAARAGGNIAYVGTVTEKDVGTWGNLAFQALKSLNYRNLNLTMNGPLAGEMITEIRFAGVSQGEGTKSNFIIRRLAKLPFVFNITVRAPFRQLLDSVRSYYDPSRLIERNLPALLEDERRRNPSPAVPPRPVAAPPTPIQPTESEKLP